MHDLCLYNYYCIFILFFLGVWPVWPALHCLGLIWPDMHHFSLVCTEIYYFKIVKQRPSLNILILWYCMSYIIINCWLLKLSPSYIFTHTEGNLNFLPLPTVILGYSKPQVLEVFKNTLLSRLYWVLIPIEDLRQAIKTARRILTKEKIDNLWVSHHLHHLWIYEMGIIVAKR